MWMFVGRLIGTFIGGSALGAYWLGEPSAFRDIVVTFSILMYALDRLCALLVWYRGL